MNFVKKLSYNPIIVGVVRFLHLEKILKYFYYYFNRPNDGLVLLKINDIEAKIYVSKPSELRCLESIGKPEGEKKLLERFFLEINTGDVVYDIGAHLGLYAIFLAKKVGKSGKVIAFEPDKKMIDNLEKSIGANNLSNVLLIKKALGDSDEVGNLYEGETIGNTSLVKTYEKTIGEQKVEIVSGDKFVFKNNLPIPKFVKIDIEGYEYFALKGLTKTLSHKDCKILCCEIHPGILQTGADENDILQLIKSFGFTEIDTRSRELNSYHIIAHKS